MFSEVYERILQALGARTQNDLALALEISQSTISDAKKRGSVPADWYIKLYDKFGLSPDWLRFQKGPMYLKHDAEVQNATSLLITPPSSQPTVADTPSPFFKTLPQVSANQGERYPLETFNFSHATFLPNSFTDSSQDILQEKSPPLASGAKKEADNVWHGFISHEAFTEAALTETVILPVWSTLYKGPVNQPCFIKKHEIRLPRYFAMDGIHIFHIDTFSLAPAIQHGAFIGVDTTSQSLQSGLLYAFCMPHEGVIFRRPIQTKEFGTFILSLEGLPQPQTFWPFSTLLECLLGRVAWTLQKT